MQQPELVLMGRASGAFGLKGEVRVFSHAEDTGVFLRGGRIFAGPNPESARPYTPVSARPHGGRVLMRLAEITTREQADELKGAWIWVDRKDLPPPGEDEYYWFQLKGARVFDAGGRALGRIKAVMDSGAHELWIVEGPGGLEAAIPAVKGVVLRMDLDEMVLVVDPPEGLLEVQGWPEPREKPSS